MINHNTSRRRLAGEVAVLLILAAGLGRIGLSKEKQTVVDPNDPTNKLFQLLDSTHDGKLAEFYVLADIYRDKSSSTPDAELQHVLRIDYDKGRAFGKMNIHVRTLDKLDPEQLKTYTPKQVYDFGEYDSEKFVKTALGPFGLPGDVYLRATASHPLEDTPITDEVRKAYDDFITQYVLPALEKK